jgi:hypothetical protein
VASNRPAKFNKDKINYMTREELIEAIEAQEVTPVETKKAAKYTWADVFNAAEDSILSDERGMEEEFNPEILFNGDEMPLSDNGINTIKSTVSTPDGSVQTYDGSVLIVNNGDSFLVSSSQDDIYEVFEMEEIDDAVDYFQEILTRNNITRTAGEVKDPSIPPMADVNWAKQVLVAHIEKRQAFAEALAVARAEIEKNLKMADLSNAEYARAEEIILRKLQAIKTGTYKIADDLYATIKEEVSGGSDSIKSFAEEVVKEFGIEKAMIDTIKARAKTPVWDKHTLLLKIKGKDQPGGAYFRKDREPEKKASTEDFQAIMNWVNNLFDGFSEYYNTEKQILDFLHSTRESTNNLLYGV